MAIFASPTSFRVTVQCNHAQIVEGLPLRVLASDGTCTEALPIGAPKFSASGDACVDLPAGTYSFEVVALRDDATIVVLRSRVIPVPRVTSTKLIAGEPQSLTVSHEKRELELTEVAVRSAAATGEVRWHRKTPSASPQLVLTPGATVRINVIGSTGSVFVAAWEALTASAQAAPFQLRTQSLWSNCRFVRRPKMPTTRSVTAQFTFPDSRMEIPVTDATRLVTNRRFMMMGYRVELDDGKCLEFEPLPYTIHHQHRFELGGAMLTPRAWADYVVEQRADSGGKQGAKHRSVLHLPWRYDLLDPGGHRLNTLAPKCGVVSTATLVNGKPLPVEGLSEQEQANIGDPTRAVRVRIEWTWNGPQSRELSPEKFVSLRSEHFQIQAIPAWMTRSHNYLSTLERHYRIEQAATNRPGPSFVTVRWWMNTSAAAGVGRLQGGQKLGCSMPFRGYEKYDDPFVAMWPIAHEMLHTFGYNHGLEMRHMADQVVGAEFNRYRWYIIDHPEIVPTMAQVR